MISLLWQLKLNPLTTQLTPKASTVFEFNVRPDAALGLSFPRSQSSPEPNRHDENLQNLRLIQILHYP